MQNNDSTQIVARFFSALQTLKEAKEIRGVQTFTRRYGINRRNLYLLSKDMTRDIFQPCWLTYLVRDYGVSPDWLLLGAGDFFRKNRKKTAREQN
ncbi:MAG: hypothetical protein KBS89_07475 [Bacteroidales bacterium]|nr:hypothetical protein [Candidatus Egerieousia equi]